MKADLIAACIAVLLAAPALAGDTSADPTGAVTDTPNPEPADAPEPAADKGTAPEPCDPGTYAGLLGKSGPEIEAMEFDVPIRIIPENGAVTMDFLPDRVNFKLDADGTVSEITCG